MLSAGLPLLDVAVAQSGSSGDQVKRLVVAIPVVKRAPEQAVEVVEIGVLQSAGAVDEQAARQGHVVHEPEHPAAGRTGEAGRIGIERAERVRGNCS